MEERKRGKKIILVFMAAVLLTGILGLLKEDAAQASQMKTRTASGGNLEEEAMTKQEPSEFMTEPELSELVQLQIPQRMEIVMDPWQIDGKEQIYSEEYTVQNTGETPGVLTLDFTCKISVEAGLSFQEDLEGLRDSKEKRLHMKALFGTGEEAVFTQEGVRYQVELQPGETLTLSFTGEINETAEEPWKDGDLEIEGMYSWEREAVRSDDDLEATAEDEKAVDGEAALPDGAGQNEDGGTVSSEEDGQNRTGGKQDVPGQNRTDIEQISPSGGEQDGTDIEQTHPGETRKGSDKENSLSGNKLEEQGEK